MNILQTATLASCLLTIAGVAPLKADTQTQDVQQKFVTFVEFDEQSSDSISSKLVFPQNGGVEESNKIDVKITLDDFSLGAKTTLPASLDGLQVENNEQRIVVLMDESEYTSLSAIDELSADADVNIVKNIVSTKLSNVQDGMHVLRVFPVTSYGTTIKKKSAFDAHAFYVKKKLGNEVSQKLSAPFITYNQPRGEIVTENKSTPVVLDFYVSNCALSKDGYKVKISIDGEHTYTSTEWNALLVNGLDCGSHTVEIQLVDSDDKNVEGVFSQAKHTFSLNHK